MEITTFKTEPKENIVVPTISMGEFKGHKTINMRSGMTYLSMGKSKAKLCVMFYDEIKKLAEEQ